MSRQREAELWAAARTVSEHAAGGRCQKCGLHGCELYRWADFQLRQWEADHGDRYPHHAPSWQAVRADAGGWVSGGCTSPEEQ